MRKSLRARLAEGPLVGTFSNIPHPVAAEILGRAGFEAVCLDGEHGSYDLPLFRDGIIALEGTGAYPLVRVGEIGVIISQVMDAGAVGVVVPRVSTAEEATAAVSFARYPPRGGRGFGYGRSTAYGSDMSRELDSIDDDTYVIVQIETAAGIEALDGICSVPGVDMILVGPFDLALSMGEEMWSAAHTAAVTSIIERSSGHGLRSGIFCNSPEQVESYARLGVDLFLFEADVTLLARQARTVNAEAVRALP
jgi:2-keto-3-deoxy-L-rhamnonate aldolase RhmA